MIELCSGAGQGVGDEEPDGVGVALDRPDPVHLRLDLHRTTLHFSWSWDGETWQNLGPALDAGRLSDEGGKGWHFTGSQQPNVAPI